MQGRAVALRALSTASENAPSDIPVPGPRPVAGGVADLGLRLCGGPLGACPEPTPLAAGARRDEVVAWLVRHRDEVITRREWPVVAEAWRLASSGLARDLVDLDRAWGLHAAPGEASLRVGQRQLARLRPLRDVRVVQRYLDAIADGRAHGWHPVVYGVWLAVFGIPLRQGLVQYAEQTLGALLDSVPSSPSMPEAGREAVHAQVVSALPSRLAALVGPPDTPLLALA